MLPLGDIQYECGDYPNLLRFYDPTWGRFRALTHPAIGNHEYLTTRGGRAAIPRRPSRRRATSTTGTASTRRPARPATATQGYYSYDVGSWHLIALNSNCARVGGCDASSPQGIWLRNDLAAHPSRCTLAYWHHPRFSSGEHGDDLATGPLWDALYAAGADVVLNGHDHDYERFAPQTPAGIADPTSGLREFVVGTGGKSHYGLQTVQPNSEVRNADTFGVLELTLRPQGYDWRFRPARGRDVHGLGQRHLPLTPCVADRHGRSPAEAQAGAAPAVAWLPRPFRWDRRMVEPTPSSRAPTTGGSVRT